MALSTDRFEFVQSKLCTPAHHVDGGERRLTVAPEDVGKPADILMVGQLPPAKLKFGRLPN